MGSEHFPLTVPCLSAATFGKVLPYLGPRALANPAKASVCLPCVLPTWSLVGRLLEAVTQREIPRHQVLQDLRSQREEEKQKGMLAILCPARLLFSDYRQVVVGSVDGRLDKVVVLVSWMRQEEGQTQQSVSEVDCDCRDLGSVSRVCISSMVQWLVSLPLEVFEETFRRWVCHDAQGWSSCFSASARSRKGPALGRGGSRINNFIMRGLSDCCIGTGMKCEGYIWGEGG